MMTTMKNRTAEGKQQNWIEACYDINKRTKKDTKNDHKKATTAAKKRGGRNKEGDKQIMAIVLYVGCRLCWWWEWNEYKM